jgi:hypothetical protein
MVTDVGDWSEWWWLMKVRVNSSTPAATLNRSAGREADVRTPLDWSRRVKRISWVVQNPARTIYGFLLATEESCVEYNASNQLVGHGPRDSY